MQPNVLTPTEAARIKGCTRQAIHAAISRGRLTPLKMGAQTLVVRDSLFEAFVVRETGGRTHRKLEGRGGGPQAPGAPSTSIE